MFGDWVLRDISFGLGLGHIISMFQKLYGLYGPYRSSNWVNTRLLGHIGGVTGSIMDHTVHIVAVTELQIDKL